MIALFAIFSAPYFLISVQDDEEKFKAMRETAWPFSRNLVNRRNQLF